MADYIDEGDLASYLQLPEVPSDASFPVKMANGLVTDVVGDLAPVPTRIVTIALEVAARGYRNPQAYSSVTVGIDDYDKTVRREGAALAAPGYYLTPDETAELLGYVGIRRRRVGSISLQVPDVP